MAEQESSLLSQKIAYIDLTQGTVTTEVVPLEWRRKFLGARGINMHILSRLTKADTDPMGPDNPFIVGVGLLTGSLAFGGSRCNLSGLSTAHGRSRDRGNIGDSNIGGHFGAELKYTGFDHLVITGQSPMPVYLLVTNDSIEIRDARRFWGLDTWETQVTIQKDHEDERMRVLCIGPAGENLARQACVITGPKDAAGGNQGMGVIMGSKNLKAIAARGSKDITYAHPEEVLDYFKRQVDVLMTHKWIKALGKLGTPLLRRAGAAGGWSAGDPKRSAEERQEAEGLFAENLLPYSVGMAACSGCAVHCRHRHLVTEGRYACRGEGPESGGLGVSQTNDPEAAFYFNDLVNRLGLDSSVGSTVSWAIKLVEKGIIDETVGYLLKKDDSDAVERLINDIAYRRGFGDIMADGKFALDQLPPEAATDMGYLHGAMHAGGGNYGNSWVPRSFVFGQLTSTIPGHIHRSRQGIDILRLPAEVLQNIYDGRSVSTDMSSYEGKAYMIYWHEILFAVCDALGCCRHLTLQNSPNCPKYEEYSELIRLTTGLDMPESYLREVGERTYTQERMMYWRFGYGERENDRLPKAWMKGPDDETVRAKLDEMLDEYYGYHGWDIDGHPLPETLERLGL